MPVLELAVPTSWEIHFIDSKGEARIGTQGESPTGIPECLWCGKRIPRSYIEMHKGKRGYFCTDNCGRLFGIAVAQRLFNQSDKVKAKVKDIRVAQAERWAEDDRRHKAGLPSLWDEQRRARDLKRAANKKKTTGSHPND